MLPKKWGEPAIFEKQIEIKLLHPASTEEVTDSGISQSPTRDTKTLKSANQGRRECRSC
ncbi:MAG: hypothetical protein P8X74_09075 [Reinekea sp.]